MPRRVPRRMSARLLKPVVERVETRLLLATFTVMNTTDNSSVGSLRWAIGQSNATSGQNTINFNIANSGVQTISPTSALPALTQPVTIDATTELGSGTAPLVELDGANAGSTADGLDLKAGDSTVEGLAINRFGGEGINLSVAGNDTIQDDFIGTDPTGTIAEGNTLDGILVQEDSNNNTILDNVISGNTVNGIYLNGQLFGATDPVTSGNLIAGNKIGTDITGTISLGNGTTGGHDGIYVQNAPMTTIGGTTLAARNIISGNGNGMELYDNSDDSVIEGNYIGLDATGSVALGNGDTNSLFSDGIVLRGISNSTIGGITPGSANVISGNRNYAIDSFVIGSGNLAIEGNFIGTDASGTVAVGNLNSGIDIAGESNVTIGGTVAGAANVISGNADDGITTFANGPGLLIEGNDIGTDLTGTLNLGNGGDGVNATYPGITIGGLQVGEGNIIANNGATATFDHSGVRVTGADTPVLSNSIYNNHLLGIELDGGNNAQAAPVLTSADSENTVSTMVGSLTAAAGTYTLQFFSTPGLNASGNAEGETLISSSTVTITGTSTNFSLVLPSGFTPGSLVTATATDPNGNTSAFSMPVTGTGTGNGVGSPTITGSATPSSVAAGQTVADGFVITNPNQADDAGLVFTDPIPSGTTFVSGTTSTGVPVGVSNGVISADLGTLPAGESVSVTVVLKTSTAVIPSFNNVGGISATSPPIRAGLLSYSIPNDVTASSDLGVTISGPRFATPVGQNLSYLVTVTNAGPSAATNLVLSDTIPTGTTLVTANPSLGPKPTLANGVLTDNFGTLASGASFTMTVVVNVGAGAYPLASDVATVNADQTDPNSANNLASITSTITPVVDVSVTAASAASKTVGVGDLLTYTFTVANAGPSPASGVVFSDALPSGLTFQSASSTATSAPAESAGAITDAIGTLAAGASVVVTILAVPTAGATPSISNTATVLANETDSNSSNNAVTVVTPVEPVADIAVVKVSTSPEPAAVGGLVTFTIEVANNGPSDAAGTVVTDTLPAGLTFVSGTAAGGPVTSNNGVVAAPLGTLDSGATSVVTIVAMANAVGTTTDTVTISAPVLDPSPLNNTMTTPVTVVVLSDLSVALSTSGSLFTGDPLVYTAVVTNNGPSTATNVVFTDPLFAGATLESIEANQVGGSVVNGVATQLIGTLASGASATVVLTLLPTQTGTFTDTASVIADQPDPDSSNNTASVTTTLTTPYRLITFASPTYSADLTDGDALITLDRSGDLLGEVTVHFSTVGGNDVVAGVDYTPVSVVVDFPAGSTQETVAIPVFADPYLGTSSTVSLQLDTPTGGAILEQGPPAGTSPTQAILQLINPNPVLVGPTITDLKLIGPVNSVTAIEVDTTGHLNTITATYAPNYSIVAFGGVKGGLKAGTVVPVSVASYNASTGAVTLILSTPLPGNELFEVDLNGTRFGAISDLAGNPLNSVKGVIPGSDYVLTVARGTDIHYTDEHGTAVELKLTGPGTIDIDRTIDGQLGRLQVVGAVARKTVLSGSVHTPGRRTTIGTILGLGEFGSFLVKLTTPPFLVTNTTYPNSKTLFDAPAVDTLIPSPTPTPVKKTNPVVKTKATTTKTLHAASVGVEPETQTQTQTQTQTVYYPDPQASTSPTILKTAHHPRATRALSLHRFSQHVR